MVRVRDVTLRDGLQGLSVVLPTATKVEVYQQLLGAGVEEAQVTSFVSPRRPSPAGRRRRPLGRPKALPRHQGCPDCKPQGLPTRARSGGGPVRDGPSDKPDLPPEEQWALAGRDLGRSHGNGGRSETRRSVSRGGSREHLALSLSHFFLRVHLHEGGRGLESPVESPASSFRS